jgi:hypothetical protein
MPSNAIKKYLEVLKLFDDYVTVLQRAEKVAEIYPDILEKVGKQAKGQKKIQQQDLKKLQQG